jgi:hypothetical protein
MDSRDLTSKQLKVLYERIRPMADYLAELQSRMDAREFSPADRLYKEVDATRATTQLLVDDLHRLWCGPGYYKGNGG